MRNIIFRALTIVFMSLFLTGCQPKENSPSKTIDNSSTQSENNKILATDSIFKSITISRSKGIDGITLDDKESLKTFQNILSSAVKEDGIVNMVDPEFYLNVAFDKDNQHILHLWIGKKGQRSTFMKAENTYTIYTISEEMTDKLSKLVET